MAYDGIAKVQHYVPRFLLRHFGHGKKHQLHVFDKRTGRIFISNARNVAAESRFYDFEIAGEPYTLETSLGVLESQAHTIFKRLLEEDTLAALSAEDRAMLSLFFAVQLTRTKAFREQWCSLPRLLGEKLRSQARNESELAGQMGSDTFFKLQLGDADVRCETDVRA